MTNLPKKSLLTLIKFLPSSKGKSKRGLYQCECGNIKEIREQDVKSFKTLSCGCILKRKNTASFKTHGLSKHRLMRIYWAMMTRCYNKNFEGYKDYGKKGIKVCERWHTFINFYNDVISTYREGLTLDRFPNCQGDYEPTNFRWATILQQANNKTSNILIEYQGIKMNIKQWSQYAEVSYDCFHDRITKQKMPIEKAMKKSNLNRIHE